MDLGLLTAKFAPMLAPPQAQEIMALNDHLNKEAGGTSMSEAATQAVIDRLAYLFNNEVIPLLETRAGIERVRMDLSHLGRGRFRGAGFLDWVKQKIASATQAATTVAKTVVERIGDVSRGVRRDYPPRVRELLARIGDKQIVAMAVRRDPIKGPLNTALNLITLGKWNEVRTRYNYDKLFHLGLEVVLDMGETEARFTVEKNEVINIGQAKATNADTEYQSVPRTVANLNVLLGKAREVMGDRFFLYDAFQNNCQDFVMNVLRANGLLTGELERFIKQPIVQVAAALPSYTSKIAKFATDAGALVNVAVEGRGRGSGRFMKQLEKADVSPEAYLRLAKKKAAAKDLNAESLTFSSDGKHKLMIKDPEGGVVHFGAIGYGDHILYTLSGDEAADAHRAAYRKRAENIKGKWRYDEYSPNSLSLAIQW
jgi:hypothetical protein